MKNLFLPFEFPKWDFEINHGDGIVLIGSCFSDEIGGQLKDNGHQVLINPFGTIFHPSPLAQNILACFDTSYQERILEKDKVFYSWDCSSKINALTFELMGMELKRIRNEVKIALEKAKVLMVTLGTSWGYELKQTQEIVANCHKAPSDYFQKFLSSSYEMLQDWIICIEKIKEINPLIQIVFTVSPVRHIKDGVIENNFSKARLIEISHQLSMEEKVSYFPSYEFMIDVLRDYRFYKKDMVHPNEHAIELIWNEFEKVAMSEDTKNINQKVRKLKMLKAHRVQSSDQNQHELHLNRIQKMEAELKELCANVGV